MSSELLLLDAENSFYLGNYNAAIKHLRKIKMSEEALKVLNGCSGSACNALSVQCLLMMDRFDLAGKLVRRMQTADEDSIPAQLATALYFLSKGGDQLQEAQKIYEELIEKHGSSNYLLNLQASVYIGTNQYDDAESLLQEASDLDGNNPDTIANTIILYQLMGKSIESVNRLMSHLKNCCKDHPLLVELNAKDEEFTRWAASYAPSVVA